MINTPFATELATYYSAQIAQHCSEQAMTQTNKTL